MPSDTESISVTNHDRKAQPVMKMSVDAEHPDSDGIMSENRLISNKPSSKKLKLHTLNHDDTHSSGLNLSKTMYDNPSGYTSGEDFNQKIVTDTSGLSLSEVNSDKYSDPVGSTTTVEASNDDLHSERICLVCGDTASGLHYGVPSCEACKAFFKLTIQGNIEYICHSNRSCEINKRRRKACQACRFQKCITVGMLREGVRLDRVRGGRQKYRRSDGLRTGEPMNSTTARQTYSDSEPTLDKLFGMPYTEYTCQEQRENGRVPARQLIDQLLNIEPEKVYAKPDPQLPDDELKLMQTVNDLVDKELVAMIGWAKQVPGFGDLVLPDQMSLLQTTWLDVLCFSMSYRSVPYKGDYVFCADYKLSEQESAKYQWNELNSVSRNLAKKMTDLNITNDEYVLMKSMLLLNPDVVSQNPGEVQKLRDVLHDALLEYEYLRGEFAYRRICNLFFLFPIVTHEKLLSKDYWMYVKKSGRINLRKLLGEMLGFLTET